MPVNHDVDVTIEPQYRDRVSSSSLRRAVECALASRNLRRPRAVSVSVMDGRALRRLNRHYLGDDEVTDVLAFNTDFPSIRRPDGVRELGVLAIALSAATRNARTRKVDLADELALLTVHGTLHLLGFDHQSQREDIAMRAMERSALECLGRPQAARRGPAHR